MSASVSAKWWGVASQVTGRPLLLGELHHVDGMTGRDVCHMEARTGGFGQQDIARYHHIFRTAGNAAQTEPRRLHAFVHVAAGAQVQVFAMVDHRKVERFGHLHRAAHNARIHHRAPVIRDRDNTGVLHRAERCQFFTGAILGDGSDGEDIDGCVLARAFNDVAGDSGVIVHRQRVGHAADGGEASRRRGARSGFDGLGMLDSRLSQMDVHVDEAGSDH